MVLQSLNGAYADGGSQVLWEDGERVFRRGWRLGDNGRQCAVLIVRPAADHPSRSSLDRLTHEYELRNDLDGAWAVRPLDLVHDAGRTALVLEDMDGEPLDRVSKFLRTLERVKGIEPSSSAWKSPAAVVISRPILTNRSFSAPLNLNG